MSTLNTEEQQVLFLINNDVDQARYFFARVKSLKWFNHLRDQKYFSPENIPFDKDGRALFWNVLDYLERISEQIQTNSEYGKELLKILEDVVQFSLNKRKINNHHIWWFGVKILNNIPNQVVKEYFSDRSDVAGPGHRNFKVWLNQFLEPSQSSVLAISEVGEKLLPKFLNDPLMVSYAEEIVEAISRIKPAGKKNSFMRENEVDLIWDEHWILDAFKKQGKNIGAKCSNSVIFVLADRLKKVLEYKKNNYWVTVKVDAQMYQLKVERISTEGLPSEEISFRDNEFRGVVSQYSEDQLQGIDVDRDYWSFLKIEPNLSIKSFQFSATDRETFVAIFKRELPSNIEWSKAEEFEHKIYGLFGGINEDYSSVWCKSLSDGPEHENGTAEILTVALRDALLGRCAVAPEQVKIILNEFLTQKYPFPIFKKCLLVCIDNFWGQLNSLFERFLNALPSPLHASSYEVELFDILENHNLDFTPEFTQRLMQFIDDVPEYYIKEGEEAVASWKYRWLSPLKDNPVFTSAYQENLEKAHGQASQSYKPLRRTSHVGFVKHTSPLTKEDILGQENIDLVKFLNEYEGADEWSGSFEGKPDKEGLKDALQQAVKEKPEKFSRDLMLFSQCHYDYVSRILWGLKDAWVSGQPILWNNLFDFCEDYLKRRNFIEQAKQAQGDDFGKGRYLWVIDIISDLIESGSRQDERTFDPKYFPQVNRIFDLMHDLVQGEKIPDTQRDAMTYAINTSVGHVIESFINFSLCVARAEKKAPENWGHEKYERFFKKGIESYIFLGRYLPWLRQLDTNFTKAKVDELAQRPANDFEWQMFIEGYLFGSPHDKGIYEWMRLHYIKAIQNNILREGVDERLVQHITIGYLNGYESLSRENSVGGESLFWKLLFDADISEKRNRWEEVVDFLWSVAGRSLEPEKNRRGEPSTEFRNKILDFWEWIYSSESLVKEKLGDKYNALLGKLAHLTVVLEQIDENSERWLMSSAPFVNENHFVDTFFMEYLTKFEDDDSLIRLGRIFLKVLENTTPMYQKEDIQTVVQRLYNIKSRIPLAKEYADKICTIYGRRGVYFLKEIWAANQS